MMLLLPDQGSGSADRPLSRHSPGSPIKSRSKNLGPSQSDEARRQWVREEWTMLGVFDRRASPLAVMDRRSGDAESFWTGSKAVR